MSKRKQSSQPRSIPYVRGFSPPTVAHKKSALGSDDNTAHFSFAGHQSIPRCTSIDDWLAQYKEDGQTVAQFLVENPWLSKRKRKYVKQDFVGSGDCIGKKYPNGKLYLLPIGNLEVSVDVLCRFATTYLGIEMCALPALRTEAKGKKVWVCRQNGDKHTLPARFASNGRLQLNVSGALQEVRHQLNNLPDCLCLMALTKYELFETKSDLFVAGMASGNQRVGVFSILRYDPNLLFSSEFWYDVSSVSQPLSHIETQRLVTERCLKLLVHETMHLLGLDHCIYFACVMNGAGNLEEDFRQPLALCPICLKKMYLLTKFDMTARYGSLRRLYGELGVVKEENWVEKRLALLDKMQESGN